MSSKPIDPTRVAEGYDRWANTHDAMPNATVAADERTFPLLWPQRHGLRVLEIGCGTGRHTRRLAAQGNLVTALDVSAGMLAVARDDMALRNVTFVFCRDRRLSFQSRAGRRIRCHHRKPRPGACGLVTTLLHESAHVATSRRPWFLLRDPPRLGACWERRTLLG